MIYHLSLIVMNVIYFMVKMKITTIIIWILLILMSLMFIFSDIDIKQCNNFYQEKLKYECLNYNKTENYLNFRNIGAFEEVT